MYKQKYVTEVQRENSMKFNYYAEWILDENLLKSLRVWKNDQHGKVTCLQQLSIGISLAQFRWVDVELGAMDRDIRGRKSREKQSEVQVHASRSSGSSRGAFSKNQFRDKGRTNDLAIFEITWKLLGIGETTNMKKFCIFRSFSTVYYFPNSDKVCRNYGENTFFAIFEIDLKP